MKWLMQKERSLQEQQSTISLEEKIKYYYTNLEKDTKGLRNQEIQTSMGMRQYLVDELRELVERY